MAKKKQTDEVENTLPSEPQVTETKTEAVIVEETVKTEEPKKKKKDIKEQLTDALSSFVGQEMNSENATKIKNIVANIVDSSTRYNINKDGSIDVELPDGSFKITGTIE